MRLDGSENRKGIHRRARAAPDAERREYECEVPALPVLAEGSQLLQVHIVNQPQPHADKSCNVYRYRVGRTPWIHHILDDVRAENRHVLLMEPLNAGGFKASVAFHHWIMHADAAFTSRPTGSDKQYISALQSNPL